MELAHRAAVSAISERRALGARVRATRALKLGRRPPGLQWALKSCRHAARPAARASGANRGQTRRRASEPRPGALPGPCVGCQMVTNLLACGLNGSKPRVAAKGAKGAASLRQGTCLLGISTSLAHRAQGPVEWRLQGRRRAFGPAAGSEPPCERSRRALRLAVHQAVCYDPPSLLKPEDTPSKPTRAAGGRRPTGLRRRRPTPLPLCATIQGPVGLELTYQNDHRDAEVSRKHGVRGKSCVEPWRQGAFGAQMRCGRHQDRSFSKSGNRRCVHPTLSFECTVQGQ